MPLRGNEPNDRIERSVHLPHLLIRDFDPKFVLDLVEQFSQVKVGIGFANVVIWPHSLPAIAQLFNKNLPNPDRDVLGDATAAVMSLVEGLIVQSRAIRQFLLEAGMGCIEEQIAQESQEPSHHFHFQNSKWLIPMLDYAIMGFTATEGRSPTRGRKLSMRSCTKSRSLVAFRSLYNPVGFDPIEVLPLHLHRYADYARFFIHVLYSQRVFKDLDEEFVPLKAKYLRKFFPDNKAYQQVRDALVESETVVCDGIYNQADSPSWRNHDQSRRSGKSFGYKLGPRWNGIRHERLTVTTKPLIKSIAKVNKKRPSEIVLLPHQHIWHCLQDITIDHRAAEQELDALMLGASPEEIDGYTGQRMICEGINNGDWFWHVCHFGRVYNNVTGLKRSLRKYLRANNQSLVGCDVSNSQPLLVGLLCRYMKCGLLTKSLSKFKESQGLLRDANLMSW
jgi:hypothetical protein